MHQTFAFIKTFFPIAGVAAKNMTYPLHIHTIHDGAA